MVSEQNQQVFLSLLGFHSTCKKNKEENTKNSKYQQETRQRANWMQKRDREGANVFRERDGQNGEMAPAVVRKEPLTTCLKERREGLVQ